MPENILEEKRRRPQGPFIPPTPQPKPISGVTPAGYKPYTPPSPSPNSIHPPIQLQTRQRIMTPTLEKKTAAEAAEKLRAAINAIPGARATGTGEYVGFHVEASSLDEMIQKLIKLQSISRPGYAKTICDGEPVRIT